MVVLLSPPFAETSFTDSPVFGDKSNGKPRRSQWRDPLADEHTACGDDNWWTCRNEVEEWRLDTSLDCRTSKDVRDVYRSLFEVTCLRQLHRY